jgi:uncharacterized protein (DUF433 family)
MSVVMISDRRAMNLNPAVVSFEIVTDPMPMRKDAEGVIRVGATRLTLDTVVAAFQDGATAEQIVEMFPGTELADVYAVISYYLRHREDVERYLQQRQQFAEEIRKCNQTRFPAYGLRERLLARRTKPSQPPQTV